MVQAGEFAAPVAVLVVQCMADVVGSQKMMRSVVKAVTKSALGNPGWSRPMCGVIDVFDDVPLRLYRRSPNHISLRK